MRRTIVIVTLVILLLAMQASSLVWAWEIERPYHDVDIKDRVDSSFTNGEASVGVGVAIDDYDEDSEFGGNDVVDMNITMTTNSRRGITYDYCYLGGLLWWDVLNPTGISGDDNGGWIDFPEGFTFRFYGGQGSGEHHKVWVCTNGFISFDLSNSTSATPLSLPSTTEPNALIAALWADLEVDATASITTGIVTALGRSHFVISWNNVWHRTSGRFLTFQIILQEETPPTHDPANVQSQIRISYKDVWTIDGYYTIGIEDHEGCKSTGRGLGNWDLANLLGETIEFYQSSSSFFMERLTIKLEEEDTEANVYINDDDIFIRGMNVKRQVDVTPEPDLAYTFLRALAGTSLFLLEVKSGLLLVRTARTLLPLITEGVLLGWDWVDTFAYWMEDKVEWLDLKDSYKGPAIPQGGYIVAAPEIEFSVDSMFGINAKWMLLDSDNSAFHSLRVTAELEYYEYTQSGQVIEKDPITTSVDLEIGPDDNEDFSTADPISVGSYSLLYLDVCPGHDPVDFYKTYVPYGHHIKLTMELYPWEDYDLYLYDPSYTLKASSEQGTGQTETIDYSVLTAGHWYIKVNAVAGYGFYNLSVKTYPSPGCPFVYTWNGTQYVLDNNLLRDSARGNGTEVEDYYRLEQDLVPFYEGYFNSYYSLRISEFQQEHSYLDEVNLFAVDHESDVSVAVSPAGEILTYQSPYAPITAVDENDTSWLDELSEIDGDYYESYNGSFLVLNFGEVNSSDAKLIMRTDPPPDGPPTKKSIHVQVLNSSESWVDVVSIIPRAYWATDIIDLSDYLPLEGELVIRLCFTDNHRVDFVGLDTTPQAEIDVEDTYLLLAYHSDEGAVTAELRSDDDVYAELVPGQQITLFFSAAKPDEEARTFIFYVKGYYYTITS